MEGDSGSQGNKKGVRRPMNAFLIFCKRQRSHVREKNPQMDNRSITRVLGDIWAKMDKEEKASFTHLAKQYKDAFMKANPGYKWHSSDKVRSASGGSGSASAPANTSTSGGRPSSAGSSGAGRHHQHNQNIHVSAEITPGKLADPGQMGGLNLLLKAGKESGLMQSSSKSRAAMTNINPSSSSASAFSSLFPFTPMSTHSPLTKPQYGQSSSTQSSSSSSSSSLQPQAKGMASVKTSQIAKQICPISSSSSSSSALFEVPEVETSTANSALLQLAEMCTTELYSGTEERKGPPLPLQQQSTVSVAPPKKRARQWHGGQSLSSPLVDDNGRKHSHGRLSPSDNNHNAIVTDGHNDLPLDLSQTQTVGKTFNKRRQSRGQSQKGEVPSEQGGGKKNSQQSWRRKRKRSSSATDSVSPSPSPTASPVTVRVVDNNVATTASSQSKSFSSSRDYRMEASVVSRPRPHRQDSTAGATEIARGVHDIDIPEVHNRILVSHESSKIASLLKAAAPLPQMLPSSEYTSKDILRCGGTNNFTKVQETATGSVSPLVSSTATTTAGSTDGSALTGLSQQQQPQPFTQGKVKKKWTQRMMVEAQQEEELALAAKKESQAAALSLSSSSPSQHSFTNISGNCKPGHQSSTIMSPCPKFETNCSNSGIKAEENNSKLFPPSWGKIDTSRSPLPPPQPINTSFPLPVSGVVGEAHRSHTLYKALTSQMSPPRHRGTTTVVSDTRRVSSFSHSNSNTFESIAACGKKFTDRIVEQLLRGSPDDQDDRVNKSTNLLPPQFTGSAAPEAVTGLWDGMPTSFSSYDKKDKSGDWATSSNTDVVKKELDVNSFPASTLFEKVARKVCGSPRDVSSPQRNGLCSPADSKSGRLVVTREQKVMDFPGSSSSPAQSQPSRPDTTASPNAALDIRASASRRCRRSSLDNEDTLQPCHSSDRTMFEDESLQPVRKSRRANRGQKYQALIEEGIIQPCKERLAVRNVPAKVVRSLSYKEEMDRDPELVRLTSCGVVRSAPSPKTVRARTSPVELFDFENDSAMLPVLPKIVFTSQQEGKRKRFCRKVIAPAADSRSEKTRAGGSNARAGAGDQTSSNSFVQLSRHGKLSFDRASSKLGAWLQLKPNMRGWCHTRIPLAVEELNRLKKRKKVGCSRRRKFRRSRILHITAESGDIVKEHSRCVSVDKGVPDASVMASAIGCSSSRNMAASRHLSPRHSPTDCRRYPPSPKPLVFSSHHRGGVDDHSTRVVSATEKPPDSSHCTSDLLSPLHLLTTAAMQSERAFYPTLLLPSSSSSTMATDSLPPSSPPLSSTNQQISTHSASVPFVDNVRDGRLTNDEYRRQASPSAAPLLSLPGSSHRSPHRPVPSHPHHSQDASPIRLSYHTAHHPPALCFGSTAPPRTSMDCFQPPPPPTTTVVVLQSSSSTGSSPSSISSTSSRNTVVSTLQASSPLSSSSSSTRVPRPSASSSSSSTSSPGAKSKSTHPSPTLLNIPAISCAGAFPFHCRSASQKQNNKTRNDPSVLSVPSHHKLFQPQHNQQRTAQNQKQSVMQRSQKLVTLLTTNSDDTSLFGGMRSPNSGNHKHFAGHGNSHPDQGKRNAGSKNCRIKNKRHAESLPINKSPFGGNSTESRPPPSKKRCTAGGGTSKNNSKNNNNNNNSVKRKKKKQMSQQLPHPQHHHHHHPTSQHTTPYNGGRVLPPSSSKLFPTCLNKSGGTSTASIANNPSSVSMSNSIVSSNASAIAVGPKAASGKKQKLTIWDHLSSQCSLPVKAATKPGKPQPHQQQSTQQAAAAVTSPSVSSQQQTPKLDTTASVPPTSQLMGPSSFSTTPCSTSSVVIQQALLPHVPPASKTSPATLIAAGAAAASSGLKSSSSGSHSMYGQEVSRNNFGGNKGSDTDSANEDDDDDDNEEKALCIVEEDKAASDTDSAEESMFDSTATTRSSRQTDNNNRTLQSSSSVSSTAAAAASVILNLEEPTPLGSTSLSSRLVSSPAMVGKTTVVLNNQKNLPTLSSSRVHVLQDNKMQIQVPSSIRTNQTPSDSSSSSVVVNRVITPTGSSPSSTPGATLADNSMMTVTAQSRPLPPSMSCPIRPTSFVSVSSITLPSDLPEGNRDILSLSSPSLAKTTLGARGYETTNSILLATNGAAASATTPPSSSQVTVKTIAPTSPYPSPHVADLSASCVTPTPTQAHTLPPPSPPATATATHAPTTKYGNILLSTLQNPGFVLGPPTTFTTASSVSKLFLPSSSSSSSSSSVSSSSSSIPSSFPYTSIIPTHPTKKS